MQILKNMFSVSTYILVFAHLNNYLNLLSNVFFKTKLIGKYNKILLQAIEFIISVPGDYLIGTN